MVKKTYHEIFVPFTDVYSIGGSEVFKEFQREKDNEKNLVVVPFSFIETLKKLTNDNSLGGSEDVLKFLKRLDSLETEGNVSLYSPFAGLDIAIMHENMGREYEYKKLEELISKRWQPKEKVSFITNSEVDHIRLRGLNLHVEDPDFLQVDQDIVNEGIILGNDELYSRLYQQDKKGEGTPVPVREAAEILNRDHLYLNQFIKFEVKSKDGTKIYYARVTGDLVRNANGSKIIGSTYQKVRLLKPSEYSKDIFVGDHKRNNILGIKPRDMEQYLAFQYGLLNPDVNLFFLCGSQGSGKTLLSYVSSIDLVLWYDAELRKKRKVPNPEGKGGFYKKIVLLKSNDILGGRIRDVGFLPGTLYDKLKPHLAPYIDAHKESLLGEIFPFEDILKHPRFENDFGEPRLKGKGDNGPKIDGCAHLSSNSEVVEMTYSGYMRGRSFRDTLVLIDEAQNFTPYEVKTIIERLGEGCKGIIMGDPLQVDNPQCNREINGLTHAIQHYLEKDYSALVKLPRNYRSQMSEDAGSWRVFSS
jgi:hypothetical protein